MEQCLEHMATLVAQALKVRTQPGQKGQVRQLLAPYADEFSSSETDVGRETLVEHEIPMDQEIVLIQQPPRKLGAEKDPEEGEQVHYLG